ncbi:SLBB domain-containing protein [Terracidiphilus sp.]|uniref:SLBB domain-containing protein n=1 Tax=Terracidiphilus sp. TaxID=1964191 RepID=UPI003C293495
MPACCNRMPQSALIAVFLAAVTFIPHAVAYGQMPTGSDPTQSTTQSTTQSNGSGLTGLSPETGSSDTQDSEDDRNSSLGASGMGAPLSLSSDQIIHILQQNPDLVVELKSEVADRLQQQGTEIDANDITDQMLYNQIETNANLRTSITTFLRARGYASSNDLPTAGSNVVDGSTGGEPFPGQRSLSGSDSTDSTRLAAASGLDSGSSSSDQNDLRTSSIQSMNSTNSMNSMSNSLDAEQRRGRETANASTDMPKVLRQPTPYNLQSMRDLYTQIPEQTASLKRFGSEVFVNRNMSAMARGGAGRDTPLDVPLGPDYVVGSGDTLTINMWGGMTQSFSRAVDRDGRIMLPDAGSLDVAGLPLRRAESLIEGALKKQYRDVQATVTVSRLRSVRVYVVGDVQRPGGYDISSLATPLSALYAAGGPTSVGSLRVARHYRGNQLVEDVDLYDFLLHGVRNGSAHFESGDTLLVPPAGPQVAISGAVKRPAIYEVKPDDSTLASVIGDAGGVTAAASFGHITIERIGANHQRETVTLKAADEENSQTEHDAVAAFQVKDGDRIRIGPILPYSQRAIYLEGHVARPGRLPYTDGMRLSDVLHSYRDMLPEPAAHGEIVRLVPPDLHAETIEFDVPEVLIGNANLDLQPFDTIRILGRYEIDAPKVKIQGEVLRPGTYPLSKDITAAQLVRMAGGFKRDALRESADLTSYGVVDGNRISGKLVTVRIGAAVSGTSPDADVPLKAGDILTIHQITGWNDIGESVTIIGQVKFPGTYGFQEGERLSSVLRRAGGFRDTAYPTGAVLVRDQVRELEKKSKEELIRQIETSSASARLSPNLGSSDSGTTLKLIQAQQDQVLAQLKSQPESGRQVVDITADIDSWANTPADIELRRGDVLTIPKRPSFVLVTGQVYNVTALTFTEGKTAKWYLQHAGGTSDAANRKDIFVIRANGSVIGRHSGGVFDPSVLSTKLDPGDVVVVPQKVIGASLFWRNLLTTAQLASSIAITAAVANI